MTSFISHTSIDCRDPHALAEWWKPVLGYTDDPEDPNLPEHDECLIIDPAGVGPAVLFLRVPEPKTVKNRIHFDLRPREDARDDELARLLEHGAVVVGDYRGKYGPGTGWVVLADPEGNEFCILRSRAEVAAAGEAPE